MDHTLTYQRPKECSKEPLMHPARPSSPRNQDVSHVLSSIFGDLYSQEVLHEDTIFNLETSRTHDPDFHDYYVQLLNEIRTERTERLTKLREVEEHIEQGYCSRGVPSTPGNVGAYLDNKLLEEYNLLTPGSYLRPSPPSISSPTLPDIPNFMRNTQVIEQHEIARQVDINREHAKCAPRRIKRSTLSAGRVRIPAPPKNAWKNSMDPATRAQEQKGLEKLKATSNFLKTKRTAAAAAERVFATEPSTVSFTAYETGKEYEAKLRIKNVSTVSRQLKVLPPRTPYFTLSKCNETGDQGGIAPGLSVEYLVTFLPSSLGRHEDELRVLAEGGTVSTVSLVAERPPPQLSLPNHLECGHTLVHGRSSLQFLCRNNGGCGVFRVYPKGVISEEFKFDDLPVPEPELKSGDLLLYPTSFTLETGQETALNVTFTPGQVGSSEMSFVIAVDNCTSEEYTISAESESCCVQLGGCDEGTIVFDDQNPGTIQERMFYLQNSVNVPLHYEWEVCKEVSSTDEASDNQETSSEPLLVADTGAPFEVEPCRGILQPADQAQFTLRCKPSQVGRYMNSIRVWLNDVPVLLPSGPVLEKKEGARLAISHVAQPHRLRLDPPALMLPGELLTSSTITKTVRIHNESLCDAHVNWTCPQSKLDLAVRPEILTVGAGSSRTVEVDITSEHTGDKEARISCSIQNVEKPSSLYIKGKWRGPRVKLVCERDEPTLDFGYIQFKEGCRAQREFDIVNLDGVEANWTVAQIQDSEFGESEFLFSETEGVLGPYETCHVYITFSPRAPKSLKSFIQCFVQDGSGCKIVAVGEVQEPRVVLEHSLIDLGVVYVGIPVNSQVLLNSLNFADATYTIRGVEGKDKNFGEVEFEEEEGLIHAGGSHNLLFRFIGREPVTLDDFTVLIQLGQGQLLPLAIKAQVRGLEIVHETPSPDQITAETGPHTPALEFGTVNIMSPCSRVLKLVNKSHIGTHFTLKVERFAGDGGAPLTRGVRAVGRVGGSTRSGASSRLLSRSAVLLDPQSRSEQQEQEEYWGRQLGGGQGVCFIPYPASGYLPGNGVTIITVHSNSDMWGSYSDVLVSQVGDLEPVRVPIAMHVINTPLVCTMSATANPTLRFGSYPAGGETVARTLNIRNKGPRDITLHWQAYNTDDTEESLVRLSWFAGEGLAGSQTKSDDPLIRIYVESHEGEAAPGPFSFSPSVSTVPARSTAKVAVRFDPSWGVTGEVGSFALAHQTLGEGQEPGCEREDGERVPPLRVQMTARVQLPELIVAAEKHGFHFKLVAGAGEQKKLHELSLLNGSELKLDFSVEAAPPFFVAGKSTLTAAPRHKLRLQHGFQVSTNLVSCVGEEEGSFRARWQHGKLVRDEEGPLLAEVDVTGAERRARLSSVLTLRFRDGHTQEVPVKATLTFPALTLTPTQLQFGEVLVGECARLSARLANPTSSPLAWQSSFTSSSGSASWLVEPGAGELPAFGSVVLTVSFTAESRGEACGEFSFVCKPGDVRVQLNVAGAGSHDEGLRRLL